MDSTACCVCDKAFTLRKNLYKHLRNVHNVEPNREGKTIKCSQDNCTFSCNFMAHLREHVKEEHMVEMFEETIEFNTWNEFLQWKTKEEKTSNASFIKHGGTRRMKDGTEKIFFHCHRSGDSKAVSEGKKLQKSQGSIKLGSHCTAAIEVTQDKSGTCSAVYCKTHFGHEQHIGFLHLHRSDREAIAAKIREGVCFQRILDDIRDGVNSEQLERLHLITRKDLHNIKKDISINDAQQHSSDDVSVTMWLDKMSDSVLLQKKCGEYLEGVDINDRLIVLMSPFQCDVLQKFGPNIVCVDTTYGTNIYKLLITTLLVVDEFGSGIPVAFCISNKENTAIMNHFFNAVKERAGIITAKVFMSDDTNIFRGAWANVMGLAENNLLCSWHVHRSWQNNLKKIQGQQKQAEVYDNLCKLLEEVDIQKFNDSLESFEIALRDDIDTKQFGIYFTDYYGFRPQQWAYCYRQDLGINTNMYLEAMHRVLKYCYLGGKQNNRLDKLLIVLLKFVRDKMFDRLHKLYKGGNSYRIRLINNRHGESDKINKEQIVVDDDGTRFMVKSKKYIGSYYTVTLKNRGCELNCKLSCSSCNICVHTLSCSCPDSFQKLNVCKHMHAVGRHYLPNIKKRAETNATAEASAILPYLKKGEDYADGEGITEKEGQLKAKLDALTSRVMSSKLTPETIDSLDKEVERLLKLSDVDYYKDLPRGANNQNMKKVTKKNTGPKRVFSKSAPAEKPDASSKAEEVLIIHAGNDHTYSKI